MNDLLLEPLKYYDTVGKQTLRENADQFFSELLTRSGIDVEENRKTVKEYRSRLDEVNALSGKILKYKIFRVLTIIAMIAGVVLLFIPFAIGADSVGILICFVGGCAVIAGSILILIKVINPLIRKTKAEQNAKQSEADKVLNRAWEQMKPLNALFTDRDTFTLIEKTVPDFSFDDRFTKAHEQLFIKEYDFFDLQNQNTSMVDTVSGSFAGNPFIFGRRRVHTLGNHTYFGTLVITWTETYRDSEGRTRTRRRTQTLTASVVKPKPFYHYDTFLAYGNQAAPDLIFSRDAEHTERLSEKEIERKVRKGEKALQKQAERSIKDGKSFQEMANSEFDVLFGATDRNNEVQFRLMYTPLAQQNTVALLTDKNNFGDDFNFTKKRRFNIITSEHAQSWDMDTSAKRHHSYDVDACREKFVTFNEQFFKSVFFDFAPLISVPAYAEEPCASLEDIEDYPCNYSYYEHEVMANAAGYSRFVSDTSNTEAILKTQLLFKNSGEDRVVITAYSYSTCERIDFVPVLGGDGRFHSVPVPWTEYIPISKTTNIAISESGSGGADTVCYHGMSIYLPKGKKQ